jgi:hypothetical protein
MLHLSHGQKQKQKKFKIMNLHNNLSVTYKTQIMQNGCVIKQNAPKRNLLLDSGLDGIAVRSFWDSFSRCVLGDGTTPTKRDSGAITVTISSETATASAGYFEAGDVGRLLKLDSGQEVYIDGFTSTTEVSVTGATDDSASQATIWYVNETGHGNELVRTSDLSGVSNDEDATWNGSILTFQREFLFPVEVSSRTYREIGWSHTSSVGGNLFGRDLIPGGGDSIAPGQQYKVLVKLQLTPSPITQRAESNVGGDFDTSGTSILQTLFGAFEGPTGGDASGDGNLEPSNSPTIGIFTSAPTLRTSPSTSYLDNLPNSKAGTFASYTAKTFEKIATAKWSTSEVNGDIFGVGYGANQSLIHKFDVAQTKDSDHTLELSFKLSWGRTLTN